MATEKELEKERTVRLRGFRYGVHDFMIELDVNKMKAVNDRIEKEYLNAALLDRKTKELIIIATCVCLRATVAHLQLHMHAAHKAGASPEEIMAVLDLVGIWTGGIPWATGLEAWRATFRPDFPTLDRVSELR